MFKSKVSKIFNKLVVITNFHAFFLFLFDNFSLLDPDLHMESGSRSENECGSGSTALVWTIGTGTVHCMPRVWDLLFLVDLKAMTGVGRCSITPIWLPDIKAGKKTILYAETIF